MCFLEKKKKKEDRETRVVDERGVNITKKHVFSVLFNDDFFDFLFLAIFLRFIEWQKPSIKGRGKFVTRMGWEIFICIFQD